MSHLTLLFFIATNVDIIEITFEIIPVESLEDSIKWIKKLNKDTLVYDIVYNPLTTLFLQSAQKEGLRVVEGLDMLLYQAQKAIQIWTGKTPDVKVMKIEALRNL